MTRSAFAFCLAGLAATPSTAQVPGAYCAPRAELVGLLTEQYGETRRGAGLHTATAIVEVFASAPTGTWTIVVSHADGTACAIAAGQAWSDDLAPPAPKSPA